MDSLEIASDQIKSMGVKFLPDGHLRLEGASCDEDPKPFYSKLVQWIEQYKDAPASNTELFIKLKYFNSSSAKCLLELLSTVTQIAKKGNLKITWCYEVEDEDMLESIQIFEDLIKYKIDVEPIDSY